MKATLILALLISSNFCDGFKKRPKKYQKSAFEFISNINYKDEAHIVETEDGYFLKMHRLLPKKLTNKKPPVFLVHGLLTTSADFLLAGPSKALAYLLSDHGYDVWMANTRGNKYSNSHRNLSYFSDDYWRFSWNEIGHYDLPAMIDYMLQKTNQKSCFFIGHSQGATAFLVLLSTRPKFNQKIIQAHLLAPEAIMKNVPHPFVRNFAPAFVVSGVELLISKL